MQHIFSYVTAAATCLVLIVMVPDAADAQACFGAAASIEADVNEFVARVVAALGTNSPPLRRCAAGKLAATAQKAFSQLTCHARAARDGVLVEPDCLARAEQRFEARFAALDLLPRGCATVGDTASIEAEVDQLVAEVLREFDLLGEPPEINLCAACKLRATANEVDDTLTCYEEAQRSQGAIDASCLRRAKRRLERAFGRCNARVSPPQGPRELSVTVVGEGTVQGTGEIDCSDALGSTCTVRLNQGTLVTVNAVADPGAVFLRWQGPCLGGDMEPTCSFSLDQDTDVTAIFGFRLEVLVGVPGSVTGSPAPEPPQLPLSCVSGGPPCTGDYRPETEVTLTANPAEPFVRWTGDCEEGPTASTCTVSLHQAQKVTATFEDAHFEGPHSAQGIQSMNACRVQSTFQVTVALDLLASIPLEGSARLTGTLQNTQLSGPGTCTGGVGEFPVDRTIPLTITESDISGSLVSGAFNFELQATLMGGDIMGTITYTLLPPFVGSFSGSFTAKTP